MSRQWHEDQGRRNERIWSNVRGSTRQVLKLQCSEQDTNLDWTQGTYACDLIYPAAGTTAPRICQSVLDYEERVVFLYLQ